MKAAQYLRDWLARLREFSRARVRLAQLAALRRAIGDIEEAIAHAERLAILADYTYTASLLHVLSHEHLANIRDICSQDWTKPAQITEPRSMPDPDVPFFCWACGGTTPAKQIDNAEPCNAYMQGSDLQCFLPNGHPGRHDSGPPASGRHTWPNTNPPKP